MSAVILVIEDNEQNLYLMRFLLEAHAFKVEEARDGRSGLALAEALKPDLILLDIQLPGMDGYAVAARLRENPRTRSIPVVTVTSYAMVGDREKALQAGATGYIEKPINSETFVDQIRPYLGGAGKL
jgi:two-component system cell cycle response regulator DivK